MLDETIEVLQGDNAMGGECLLKLCCRGFVNVMELPGCLPDSLAASPPEALIRSPYNAVSGIDDKQTQTKEFHLYLE